MYPKISMRLLVWNILGLAFFGCSQQENPIEQPEFTHFQIPVIVDTLQDQDAPRDTFAAIHIEESEIRYAGRFSFSDTIELSHDIRNMEEDWTQDYEDFHHLEQCGFEIHADYATTIYSIRRRHRLIDSSAYAHYPIFLVNTGQTQKFLLVDGGYVQAIQEGVYAKGGYFAPIEQSTPSDCGSSQYMQGIRPGEFALLLAAKYKGNFKTKLRFRLRNQESILVSTSYEGIVDSSQFNIKDSADFAWGAYYWLGVRRQVYFLNALHSDWYKEIIRLDSTIPKRQY